MGDELQTDEFNMLAESIKENKKDIESRQTRLEGQMQKWHGDINKQLGQVMGALKQVAKQQAAAPAPKPTPAPKAAPAKDPTQAALEVLGLTEMDMMTDPAAIEQQRQKAQIAKIMKDKYAWLAMVQWTTEDFGVMLNELSKCYPEMVKLGISDEVIARIMTMQYGERRGQENLSETGFN